MLFRLLKTLRAEDMSGFTSIELLMLLDSGAAYHSPQGIRVRTANLSPAVKALVAARLKATPCAACKAAAAQALLAGGQATACSWASVSEPG